MREEEFFLLRKKRVRCSNDWPQRRRHLHRDEQKNDDPGVKSGVRPGVRVGKPGLQKSQAENRRDEPENQMQRAHPRERFGGLRKNPRNRREADEQNRHQHQQPREQPEHFGEPRLRTAQAGENVKARQTNQQQDISEFSVSRSLSSFVGVLGLRRLHNTRLHSGGLRDGHTRREWVLSFKQRRCNEANQYHSTQQSPHENDWLPGNENVHGRTSGDEERLTIADIILRNPKTLILKTSSSL